MRKNPRLLTSRRFFSLCVALTLVTASVYLQLLEHDFINFDDPSYVTDNLHVRQGLTWQTVRWAFAARDASNWHPLTWISHALDAQMFGLSAHGHHLTSLLLHVGNVLLLFLVLAEATNAMWPSALVAALFGLHPLHVESVAWVAERKDVLGALFWMLTMLAYVRYNQRPSRFRYALVVLTFGLGLMAKPMLVTLPCVLLLLDFWPLGRMRRPIKGITPLARLVAEKLPLFALAAASSIITFTVQRSAGSVASLTKIPLQVRFGTALLSYVTYMRKMLWPVDLAIFYPYVRHPSRVSIAGAAILLAAITFLVIRQATRRPYLLVGWLWYLGTLVPVLGIVQVGDQALADRYTYIPLIGLFIIVAWGGSELFADRYAAIGASLALVALGGCAVVTWRQIQYWQNSDTLFAHALRVTENNDIAHLNLGVELQRQGRPEEATRHFVEALRITPDYAAAHNDLALALETEGDEVAATEHYRAAVRLAPRYADAHYNLANLLTRQGRHAEAEQEYLTTLDLSPGDAQAHNNFGLLLSQRGDLAAAIEHFQNALRLNPRFEEARINLGAAYKAQGQLAQAIAEYSAVLRINPDSTDAHNNVGNALAQQRRFDEAVVHYADALRINPAYAEAHFNWGNTMAQQGKFAEAIAHYAAALRIDPNHADAARMMARAQAASNTAP